MERRLIYCPAEAGEFAAWGVDSVTHSAIASLSGTAVLPPRQGPHGFRADWCLILPSASNTIYRSVSLANCLRPAASVAWIIAAVIGTLPPPRRCTLLMNAPSVWPSARIALLMAPDNHPTNMHLPIQLRVDASPSARRVPYGKSLSVSEASVTHPRESW